MAESTESKAISLSTLNEIHGVLQNWKSTKSNRVTVSNTGMDSTDLKSMETHGITPLIVGDVVYATFPAGTELSAASDMDPETGLSYLTSVGTGESHENLTSKTKFSYLFKKDDVSMGFLDGDMVLGTLKWLRIESGQE